MKKIKIAVFDSKSYDECFLEKANRKYKYEIKYFANRLNTDSALMAQGCQVVSAFVNGIVDKKTVQQLRKMNIELIALRSAGYNNVDLKAVYKKIHVVRVPDYSPYAVAEHAVALMLCLNRKLHRAYNRVRDLNFALEGLLGFDMHNKTAAIIGTGRIGQKVAHILKCFNMKLLAYDPRPKEDFAKELNIEYVGLNELLKRSDIISLHAPLSKSTYHLLNSKTLCNLKNGAMIINTSRGQLIDTNALIEVLKSGKAGGAALDVYEEESEYFFEDFSNKIVSDDTLARLLTFPNVLITSHQAFFTKEALTQIAKTTLENIEAFFKGKPLENEICYKACAKNKCKKEERGRCW